MRTQEECDWLVGAPASFYAAALAWWTVLRAALVDRLDPLAARALADTEA